MRFKSPLKEAIFLYRPMPFLVEATIDAEQRQILLRCPNMDYLGTNEILGSRIWFSESLFFEHLHTWELVEIDGGNLVSINREIINEITLEAILAGLIPELKNYEITQINPVYKPGHRIDILLKNSKNETCYINVEHIILRDHNNSGILCEPTLYHLQNIEQLIQLKKSGHRAILFFCVTNTVVDKVSPFIDHAPEFNERFRFAQQLGVEILAYKAEIDFNLITLKGKLPILLEEIPPLLK